MADIELCEFYEGLENAGAEAMLPPGACVGARVLHGLLDGTRGGCSDAHILGGVIGLFGACEAPILWWQYRPQNNKWASMPVCRHRRGMQSGVSVSVLHDHQNLVCYPHPPGVYTLADLREFGRKRRWCPYFLARHLMAFANVVVYNYQYMIDPKVSQVRSCTAAGSCTVAQRACPMLGAVFVPARPFP